MRLAVKRSDKIEGYSHVPITVLVEIFDKGRNLDDSFEKHILNNEIAVFDFESHEFDVTCHVDFWTLRDWIGLTSDGVLNLPCGLRKPDIEYLGNYESQSEIEEKQKIKESNDLQRVITERLHPSQVIDRKKQVTGLAIMMVGMLVGMTGIFILSEHTLKNYFPLGWLFAAVGAVGLFWAAFTIGGSGANDPRCKNCNSNKIRLLKEDEEYKGTYSKQENVLNKNTGYTEFARVTKTDFLVTEYHRCDLCSHTWTNRYTRSTTSN